MIIVGNWKMNGSFRQAKETLTEIARDFAALAPEGSGKRQKMTVLLCLPTTILSPMVNKLRGKGLQFGGQDCHTQPSGAFTGDISAEMLADAGARYVLVGHSERRLTHHEKNEEVASKALAAKRAGLIPIICVGENLAQREAGETETILREQVTHSIPSVFTAEDFILAYEPIWAIGTGKVASAEMIAATHQTLISFLPEGSNLLYGGSVNAENAAEILAIPFVNGVLVGGASLQAASFNAIIAAAARRV
jgi:triosephosphate isomerase